MGRYPLSAPFQTPMCLADVHREKKKKLIFSAYVPKDGTHTARTFNVRNCLAARETTYAKSVKKKKNLCRRL